MSANVAVSHILLKTRFFGLHIADSMGVAATSLM